MGDGASAHQRWSLAVDLHTVLSHLAIRAPGIHRVGEEGVYTRNPDGRVGQDPSPTPAAVASSRCWFHAPGRVVWGGEEGGWAKVCYSIGRAYDSASALTQGLAQLWGVCVHTCMCVYVCH